MCNAPFNKDILMTAFLTNFPKISKNSPKLFQRSHECCQTFFTNFQRLQKIVFSSKTLVCNNRYVFFLLVIRAICKADASAVLGFETTLFPVIQEILTNDVTGTQSVTSWVSCSVWLECYFIFT